jgi:hypothetical protein
LNITGFFGCGSLGAAGHTIGSPFGECWVVNNSAKLLQCGFLRVRGCVLPFGQTWFFETTHPLPPLLFPSDVMNNVLGRRRFPHSLSAKLVKVKACPFW